VEEKKVMLLLDALKKVKQRHSLFLLFHEEKSAKIFFFKSKNYERKNSRFPTIRKEKKERFFDE